MKMQRHARFIFSLFLLLSASSVPADGSQFLYGHVPAIVANLQPLGEYPRTNRLHLAISLPLRNQSQLSDLLAQIYNPASPNYRHYLTPEQFTDEFGPGEQDYQAVMAFANSNGLRVTRTYPNRVLVDVEGSVEDIERATHTFINVYRHPTENRNFYAPINEPSLDLSVPILHISGLDNYALPHPHLVSKPLVKGENVSPDTGSGTNGTYIGEDFRSAYAPGALLNGSGQSVGLLEYDGYSPSDINYYEGLAGLPNVPLQNVLIDGAGSGPVGPTDSDQEVALDIEMVISMATNLSQVVVFIASADGTTPIEDILNQMVADTRIKQFSSSWNFSGMGSDPSADQIWEQMAAQGQSFFNASGDDDAYTGLISFPCDSPYLTQVGGTTLTTSGPGGEWIGEQVWNNNDGVGSGGGISTQYPIPSWQTNISMAANQGSTTMRNVPDVAMVADNVYVREGGSDFDIGGTSCAAPLWAGFAALVNEQAADSDKPPIGLINAGVDAIGTGFGYGIDFNDIYQGNNFSASSPNMFSAKPGYDLCTGWGTPTGPKLIDALADPDALVITPHIGITSTGGPGGPFTVTSEDISLGNSGTNTLAWMLSNTSIWLTVSSEGGAIAPGHQTNITVSLNTAANNLPLGTYSATLWFTNVTDGYGQGLANVLNVIARSVITSQPTNQSVLEPQTATFSVAATGGLPLVYQWQFNGTNLTDGGNISGSQTTNLIVSDVSQANVGNYRVTVTNMAGAVTSSNAALTIIPSKPVIVMQPSNQTVLVGQTVVFSVNVIGNTPYSYQWTFDGANIDGATNNSLTLTNVQTSEAGSYSVTIANDVGSTLSSNAVLTIYGNPPSISGQPGNVTTPSGGSATFVVYAGGTPPLDYQWNFNGTTIAGATNSLLTLNNVQPSQAGSYAVNISSPYGSINSSDATLTVSAGVPPQFFDDFSGPSLNPIWQTNLPNEAICASFVNGNYENAEYIGEPTFTFGLLDSNTVLNMRSVIGPAQRVGWSSTSNFMGSSFRYEARFNTGFLSPTTSVDGFLEIWLMNATNDNLYSMVSANQEGSVFDGFNLGYEDTFYETHPVTFANNTWYRLALQSLPGQGIQAILCDDNERELISSGWGDDGTVFGSGFKIVIAQNVGTSGTNVPTAVAVDYVSLTSQFSPLVIHQPQNQTVAEGADVTFSVIAEGTPPLGYQWAFDGADIVGATNSTLTLTNVQAANQGSYSVLVTNFYGSASSSIATLTIPGNTGSQPSLTISSSFGLLFIEWPTNSAAGLVLVTTTNLESGTWAPVTQAPVQEGNQYFEAISPTSTNAFYRLQGP